MSFLLDIYHIIYFVFNYKCGNFNAKPNRKYLTDNNSKK